MVDIITLFYSFLPGKRVVSVAANLLLILCAGCLSKSPPLVPDAQRYLEVEYDYVLGPGASVEILVWGNEELTTTAIVRPDGKITTQLVEDLQASGKTSSQLARDIEEAYSEYVRSPVVSVIVRGFAGVSEQQIHVMGEATNAKKVPFQKHMTLLDLMIQVGGITDYAAGNKSVLIRRVDGKQVSYRLRLDDLLDGDISANMSMMPGDILIITESWF